MVRCRAPTAPTEWWAAWRRSWRRRRAQARCVGAAAGWGLPPGQDTHGHGASEVQIVLCKWRRHTGPLQYVPLACFLRLLYRSPLIPVQTVLEGDLVNLGVTSPAAALALGLMYLQVQLPWTKG